MTSSKKPTPIRWQVVVKDDRPDGYEISVVRKDNTHGIKSYGLADEHKHIVACDYCGSKCHPFIWKHLKNTAKLLCEELNRRERVKEYRRNEKKKLIRSKN